MSCKVKLKSLICTKSPGTQSYQNYHCWRNWASMGRTWRTLAQMLPHLSWLHRSCIITEKLDRIGPRVSGMYIHLLWWVYSGHGSPLGLQSYNLYRVVDFHKNLVAPLTDSTSPRGAMAHSLETTVLTNTSAHKIFLQALMVSFPAEVKSTKIKPIMWSHSSGVHWVPRTIYFSIPSGGCLAYQWVTTQFLMGHKTVN